MARGKQLSQLVDMLRAETGQSTSVSVGVSKLPELKQLLRRTQETLYDAYDWPFLRVQPFKNLSAGARYYDFPTDLNMERVEEVVVWWNGEPFPLTRGIGFENYAAYDSANDERTDPVTHWDVRWTGSAEQVEVWPIPATTYTTTNKYRLQFKGIRPLRTMVSDSDVADLDDQLIVLFAAAEILARQKSEDAQAKQAKAVERFNTLKGRTRGGSSMFVLGGGTGRDPQRTRGTVIRVTATGT